MLQISKLHKKYGDKTILDIDTLELHSGIIHLKGINGSGKTTFSKIIAGLIPFSGDVLLDNKFRPNRDRVTYRRLVNYAESEPNFPEFLTANDLIQFIGKAKGASAEDIDLMSETFGVNEYLYDHVGTYSSGMLKRLSLCLAFLGDPSLIILDEPFNTLDTEATEILIRTIDAYHAKKVSFLLVSHQDIASLGMRIDSCYHVKDHKILEA